MCFPWGLEVSTRLMRCVATEQSGFLMAMLCGVPMCLAASPKPKVSSHGPVGRQEINIMLMKAHSSNSRHQKIYMHKCTPTSGYHHANGGGPGSLHEVQEQRAQQVSHRL